MDKAKKCSIAVDTIRRQAQGRWKSIFDHFGVDVGGGEHRPCPACGGTDRFRFDNKDGNGTYFCNGCGAGDGLSLLSKTQHEPFYEIIGKVAEIIGCCEEDNIQDNRPDPSIALNKLWQSSSGLTGSDPVSSYLRNRGLLFHPKVLRCCTGCYNAETKQRHPAMIAKLVDPEGKPVTIHRTYLTMDGEKADVPKPKKLMPGKGNARGCAIRLFPPKNGWVGVAEGIETAISCHQLFDVPCWAVTGTSLMEAFSPPEGVKKISIYADRDANFSGEKAAYALAKRLYIEDYIVEVVVPDEIGDFNDIVRAT